MIVHPPELDFVQDQIKFSARVEAAPLFGGMPERVWFAFPSSYARYLDARADGLVATLLLVAMRFGQDLDVRGPISPRLLQGLEQLQQTLLRLFPSSVKRVAIHAPHLASPISEVAPRGVATAFSGGVDSFYSLWTHLPEQDANPATRVTHGLFVHGFDIPLDAPDRYAICRAAYAKLFQRLDLELLVARTNARAWYPTLEWNWMYISSLAGAALTLNRLLGRFYIPTGSVEKDAPPWGEFTRINSLFSTETLQVVDDGVTATKADKLGTVAHWEVTYPLLRVCFENGIGLENCSRCSKCLATMVGLQLYGTLHRYTTFSLPLDRHALRTLHVPYASRLIYQSILIKAIACGRDDLALDLGIAFIKSYWGWFRRGLQRRNHRA